MATISNIRQVGIFILQVQVTGSKTENFLVHDFTLNKEVGKLVTLQCALKQFTTHNSFSHAVKLSSLSELVRSVQTATHMLKCTLVQYLSTSAKPKRWFTGRLNSTSNRLSTAYGVASVVSCSCTSAASQLLYNYIADYTEVPGSAHIYGGYALSNQQLGVMDPRQAFTSTFKSGKDCLQYLSTTARTAQKPMQHSILQLLQCPFQAVQARRNSHVKQALGDKAFKPTVKSLKDYMSCNYRLGNLLCDVSSDDKNPWLAGVNFQFINGMQNATILESTLSVLKSRMLTIVPQGMDNASELLKIQPAGVQVFDRASQSVCTLKAQRVSDVILATDAISKLKVPDRLFVNLAAALPYTDPVSVAGQGLQPRLMYYGEYPPLTYKFNTDQNLRIRSIQSPEWLLNLTVAGLKQAKNKDAQQKQAIQKGASRLETIKSAAATTSKAITDMKTAADAFAAQMYYNLYCNINSAQLVLALTDQNLSLDKRLNQTLKLEIPLSQTHLNGTDKKIPMYYGKLCRLSYTYISAKSPDQVSDLQVKATMRGVTSVQNPIAKILFQQGRTLQLYSKIK